MVEKLFPLFRNHKENNQENNTHVNENNATNLSQSVVHKNTSESVQITENFHYFPEVFRGDDVECLLFCY